MKKLDNQINLYALSMGDVKAFDKLFISFYPKVKSFLFSLLDNEDEAEDLAQDVFIRLWQNRKLLRNVQNLNAYIYQTVKHIFYSYLDKRKDIFSTEIDSVFDTLSTDDIEALVYCHELENILNKVIDNMPPQRKQIFCMSRRQGMSIEEISKKLGISKRTVETHISLALRSLRNVMMTIFILF